MYLLYDIEQKAWLRSEKEGIRLGLSYHTTGVGSRYATAPQKTADSKWALPVDGYNLSESEVSDVVEDVVFPEPLEDT